MKRSFTLPVALVVTVSILMSACGGSDPKSNSSGDSEKTPTKTVGGKVTLQPLFFTQDENGFKGGTSDITLELRKTDTKAIRVAISDDEVQGSGPQWEAAAWNAMAVSTLVTGASLDKRQLEVDATGFIDGPSAGALMTVGTISLIRGDKMNRDVTMTGTINPDGTIGPVGGIQYKLEGAAKAGKETVLIPTGQILEQDETGQTIDLKAIGKDLGLKVEEVDNIYVAYKEFTGQTLPRFAAKQDPELSKSHVEDLTKVVKLFQREYDKIANTLPALGADLAELSAGIVTSEEAYQESKTLVRNGKPAAALSSIREAYSLILAVEQIISYQDAFVAGGTVAGDNVILALDDNFKKRFEDFSDTLKDYEPETLGHAANLIDSYGTLIVSAGLAQIAVDEVQSGLQQYDPVTVISYIAAADAGMEIQQEIFDAFSDTGGPSISTAIAPETAAKFFRQGADANIAAFRTTTLEQIQAELGATPAQAEELLKQADPSVALVLNSQQIERIAEDLFGNIDNLVYAQLGASVELYARSSELLAGYYSLGIPSFENGRVTISAFRSDKAFRATKRLAKEQLSGVGNVLSDKGIEPIFVASAFELANENDSSADPEQAIHALRVYWKGFVAGRVLTYLGGFPRAGLEK